MTMKDCKQTKLNHWFLNSAPILGNSKLRWQDRRMDEKWHTRDSLLRWPQHWIQTYRRIDGTNFFHISIEERQFLSEPSSHLSLEHAIGHSTPGSRPLKEDKTFAARMDDSTKNAASQDQNKTQSPMWTDSSPSARSGGFAPSVKSLSSFGSHFCVPLHDTELDGFVFSRVAIDEIGPREFQYSVRPNTLRERPLIHGHKKIRYRTSSQHLNVRM